MGCLTPSKAVRFGGSDLAMYRTNFFNYNDRGRIGACCGQHGVTCTYNGRRAALVADDLTALKEVVAECFDGRAKCSIDGDVLLVNV